MIKISTDFEIPYEGLWINDWISRRAELTPDWVALVDYVEGDRRLTFRELNERAKRIAGFLKFEAGVTRGDIVAIISWPRIEVIETLLACMKIGAILAPVNTRYTSREAIEFLAELGPKVLIYESEFASIAEEIRNALNIKSHIHIGDAGVPGSQSYKTILNYDKPIKYAEKVSLEDPVVIFQTGGTTGKPKIAFLTYRTILWNAVNTVRDLIIPGDVTITAVPLFHIGGFTYTIPLLFWGGTNIIMRRWNIQEFIKIVNRERPSFLFLVPTQLKMLIESKEFWEADFNSVRWITSGGAALTKNLILTIMKKGIVQKQGYGLTEMGPGVFALDPWDARRKMGSIGKPNLLVEAKVVDKEGKEVGAQKEGLLLLRGPSLFGGYWKNPEQTQSAFKDGWLNTGDIVYVDEEGYYWVLGREKHVIRSGAETIIPEEVEKILLDHPKIADVVVIGVPDELWGEVPKALIVLKPGENITKEEIYDFLKDKLAKYKWPKYIHVVPEIPKTPLGKVSRKELTAIYGTPEDKF